VRQGHFSEIIIMPTPPPLPRSAWHGSPTVPSAEPRLLHAKIQASKQLSYQSWGRAHHRKMAPSSQPIASSCTPWGLQSMVLATVGIMTEPWFTPDSTFQTVPRPSLLVVHSGCTQRQSVTRGCGVKEGPSRGAETRKELSHQRLPP
jgi:hypothetical protein